MAAVWYGTSTYVEMGGCGFVCVCELVYVCVLMCAGDGEAGKTEHKDSRHARHPRCCASIEILALQGGSYSTWIVASKRHLSGYRDTKSGHTAHVGVGLVSIALCFVCAN